MSSFANLSAPERPRYLAIGRAMLDYVRASAVPIIIAPPLGWVGEIHGATGFVFRHPSGSHHLATAHHVLLDGYENRAAAENVSRVCRGS